CRRPVSGFGGSRCVENHAWTPPVCSPVRTESSFAGLSCAEAQNVSDGTGRLAEVVSPTAVGPAHALRRPRTLRPPAALEKSQLLGGGEDRADGAGHRLRRCFRRRDDPHWPGGGEGDGRPRPAALTWTTGPPPLEGWTMPGQNVRWK